MARWQRTEPGLERTCHEIVRMVADLHGGAVGSLTKVAGIGGGGQNQILFAIEGTTSDPKFVPDVAGLAAGLAAGQLTNAAKGQVPGQRAVTKGLGGLLGHKKQ